MQAIVGIALARSVGPAEYGTIVGFAGAVLFWFIVCDLGIASYVPRARAVGDAAAVSTSLLLNVATAALGALIAIAATFLGPFDAELAGLLTLIVVGQALDKNIDAAVGVPIADGERVFPAVSVLLRRMTTAAVFFVALLGGWPAVPAYCLAAVAGPVAGQIHMRLRLATLGLQIRVRHAKGAATVVRQSSFFAVTDIGNQSRSLDVAIVGLVSSAATGGFYAGASKLIAPFSLVASTLAAVVLPRAARSTPRTVYRVALSMGAGALVLFVLAVPLAFILSPFITLILGEEFASAAPALAALILGLPFVALTSPLDALLQGTGRERFVAANALVFAVILVLAIFIGAAWGGATGAAVSVSVVSFAKSLVLFLRVCAGGRD
ncbi:lipopolysaccharide biosynthesis protein [Ornithinimicrobium pratense]|uniref:Oligosaccharide flippase family protein n=1 Tax=Ornithinimicrobium pratense TaxID=2593973 RepID=A0A5J6V962_9MICO|nr:hypothetical protein [Ornithinimicrobium pratense]QFG69726.1 hypothetical protein FY030_14365 [Ornithinimicrobium pratense]